MPIQPARPPEQIDERTTAQLMRQWQKLDDLKKQMVKAGLVNGDADPHTLISKLREVIPPDLFT